ncbi:hypothetical protein PGT21_028443 [Puccinia graminis f. sp. tritici]|uniref:Uncharacterized protein n=1 Tax=Puccinia graminis f. sp. tritici TaxID=56615 RepID=A0A5B0PSA2_PUCGR|nr:hypothetical protein PGTUg99_011038 [Puccinia graminis f. sp. tritici]KAA1104627.1 hypothetical protein PGT21_028443 [Puccinia graminis f. sp. tritici]
MTAEKRLKLAVTLKIELVLHSSMPSPSSKELHPHWQDLSTSPGGSGTLPEPNPSP